MKQNKKLYYNNFFNEPKIYPLSNWEDYEDTSDNDLQTQYFLDALSNEKMNEFIHKIALFLKDQDTYTIYNYFYKNSITKDANWHLASAKLHKDENGNPKEVSIFSYDLGDIGESKKKVYRILNDQEFFKNNFKPAASLTKREKEVILLLASETDIPTCATQLGISINTFHVHRKNIYTKLGIKNRLELLRFAEAFYL